MKKVKKRIIERYVELRCKRLMNECSRQPLNEYDSWNFLGMELPTWNQAKKNASANWDKMKSDPIGTVRDIGNFYADVPLAGKVPGIIGGGIDAIQGAVSGDKGQVIDGLTNIAFSGVGGGPGKAIKNTVKDMVGDTVNKNVKGVVADTAKINVKNAYKDNLNPDPNNTNPNVVTAGPNSGGGGSNQVAVNTPTTNTNQVPTNTSNTEYVPQSQQRQEYVPQTRG